MGLGFEVTAVIAASRRALSSVRLGLSPVLSLKGLFNFTCRSSVGEEKNLSNHMGITGMLLPALALGLGFGVLAWVLAVYAAFYCGGCLLVSLNLIRRVESETR